MNESQYSTQQPQYSHDKIQKIGIALWLRDNTSLNATQIAQISGLHLFEAILIHKELCYFTFAHINPVQMNMISQDQIRQMECNPSYDMRSIQKITKRYIPKSLRQYVPGAVMWINKNYPHVNSKIIAQYMGVSKNKINDILSSNEEPISPILVQLLDEKLLQQMLKES